MSALLVDIDQLADMHVVYRLFDAAGRLVYVGMTGNLGRRLADHADKAWFLAVTSITLERFTNAAEAALAEDTAIDTENPLINQKGLSKEEADRRARVKRVRISSEKLREAEERRQRAAEEKQRIADEKREAAEERARLLREQPPRDLIADLNQLLGDERVRISALPHLLRQLAPTHVAYQSLNGLKVAEKLRERGVRITRSGNVARLDPADLRQAIGRPAA